MLARLALCFAASKMSPVTSYVGIEFEARSVLYRFMSASSSLIIPMAMRVSKTEATNWGLLVAIDGKNCRHI